MEKIKNFFNKHGTTLLYIIGIMVLAITLLCATMPNIDIDVRVDKNYETINKTKK